VIFEMVAGTRSSEGACIFAKKGYLKKTVKKDRPRIFEYEKYEIYRETLITGACFCNGDMALSSRLDGRA
jgi:hypothetical protein